MGQSWNSGVMYNQQDMAWFIFFHYCLENNISLLYSFAVITCKAIQRNLVFQITRFSAYWNDICFEIKIYHFLCEFRMIIFTVIIFVMKVQTSQPLVCFSNLEAKVSVCLIDIIWFDRHSKELHLHLTLTWFADI